MNKGKEKRGINLTTIIILGTALIFILAISLFGIFTNTDNSTYFQNYGPRDQNQIKKGFTDFLISGVDEVAMVDNQNEVVKIVVSGIRNKITVTEETEVSEIVFSGSDNSIYLCQGIHNPKITKSGLNNQIAYNNC